MSTIPRKALSMLSKATARNVGRTRVALSTAAVVAACAYVARTRARRQKEIEQKRQSQEDGDVFVDGDEASPKEITYTQTAIDLLDQIKIIDVVRYITGLCRDLVEPERLKRDPKNYAKRLLSIV